MRYKKNFYYINIEYTNTIEGNFVGDNETILYEFHSVLKANYDWPNSIIEFGCDLGNRIDHITVEEKLGIEFDHVMSLYYNKHMKSRSFAFQDLEEFLMCPVNEDNKFDCGLFVDIFTNIESEDYNDLILKMLDYCDVLFLVSKEWSAQEMAKKITDQNLDISEVRGKNIDHQYNFLFIERINKNENA